MKFGNKPRNGYRVPDIDFHETLVRNRMLHGVKYTKSAFTLTAALLVLLCACSDTEAENPNHTENSVTTAAVTEEAPKYTLPQLDYGGEPFVLVVGDAYIDNLVDDEETGDPLDDAKYRMVRTVEETLNVDISDYVVDFDNMTKFVQQYTMSGSDAYDCIAMMDRFALASAMDNAFIQIQDIETIHLNAEYWGCELSDIMTIGGNQYFGISSVDLRSFRNTACILMNTNLAASLELEIPYEDVFAGTWTFEDFKSYDQLANSDLNGDGVWNEYDRYTYGCQDIRSSASQLYQAFGLKIVEKDEDDLPVLTVYDNVKMFDSLTAVHDLLYTGNNNVSVIVPEDSNSNTTSFIEGRTLLLMGLFYSFSLCREMEDDFAVLPMPKYDEKQENYYSRTFDAIYYMVPITQSDPSFSGAVMDAMSCVSYYNVLPVYIDTVLKDKISRDAESKRSIQLCFDTRTVDWGEAFLFDYFGDSSMNNMMKLRSFNVVSFFERSRKKAEKRIENIIEAFENIGEN